ncbi:hypothetical protein [Paraburkholderia fungorum]|jgi:hypothetical protein|uniref:Uncharacterized protein n=1 Tax=Paraburkholderia fungorum TaxID=134537 RepID=A0AAW3V292_9BURK|nr:hypothetical protein [Paraburkholderia fungorum]MBB4516487.1 hypothetical protein [Paraburkholderia fungorum]MBB5545256.1 hypothetical protein [Paraburkholderia fungorum]MBB6205040.1 hypothetical protein [Paraburkholderia fungorum]MBU7440651.1 hypothetical protein [Paraburkholderia fungorum]MDE1007206.1 hypothetical protein [Paraburkholderia fungorum]
MKIVELVRPVVVRGHPEFMERATGFLDADQTQPGAATAMRVRPDGNIL